MKRQNGVSESERNGYRVGTKERQNERNPRERDYQRVRLKVFSCEIKLCLMILLPIGYIQYGHF